MADLLLHSMAEFTCIILPSLEIAGAKRIVEIGSEYGEMTEKLIEYTGKQGGELISIDPSPLPQAEKLFKQHPHARLERNRLECYLKVIEWQDRYHEGTI
jgi:tRNA A22 N-methylase